MRMLALVGVLFAVGCGPAGQFDGQRSATADAGPAPLLLTARVQNDYAESLFTLKLGVIPPGADGGAANSAVVFENVRVASGRTHEANFGGSVGDRLFLDFTGTSLGMPHGFTAELPPVTADNKTLFVQYDYDLALARFRARYAWKP